MRMTRQTRAVCGALLVTLSLLLMPQAHAITTTPTMSLLKKLKVASEHSTGYQRSYFKHWSDANRNGCNTRKEVLMSEALKKPLKRSSCTLSGGRWKSVYDNIVFTNARLIDIDHMVPLSEAWQSGAYRWDSATREAYANDLGYARSLIAVSATSNRAKGDQDPYLWMPTNRNYWCQYVSDWIAVKYRWGLTIDSTEKRDLVAKVNRCGKNARAFLPQIATKHFSKSGTSNTSTNSGPSSSGVHTGLDPRFSSCTKAKAAGYGPYYRGRDAEYSWYRDGDGDGIACE